MLLFFALKVEPRKETDGTVSSERRVTITGSPEACWRVSGGIRGNLEACWRVIGVIRGSPEACWRVKWGIRDSLDSRGMLNSKWGY